MSLHNARPTQKVLNTPISKVSKQSDEPFVGKAHSKKSGRSESESSCYKVVTYRHNHRVADPKLEHAAMVASRLQAVDCTMDLAFENKRRNSLEQLLGSKHGE